MIRDVTFILQLSQNSPTSKKKDKLNKIIIIKTYLSLFNYSNFRSLFFFFFEINFRSLVITMGNIRLKYSARVSLYEEQPQPVNQSCDNKVPCNSFKIFYFRNWTSKKSSKIASFHTYM